MIYEYYINSNYLNMCSKRALNIFLQILLHEPGQFMTVKDLQKRAYGVDENSSFSKIRAANTCVHQNIVRLRTLMTKVDPDSKWLEFNHAYKGWQLVIPKAKITEITKSKKEKI